MRTYDKSLTDSLLFAKSVHPKLGLYRWQGSGDQGQRFWIKPVRLFHIQDRRENTPARPGAEAGNI